MTIRFATMFEHHHPILLSVLLLPFASQPLQGALVAHYRFDEAASATIAVDSVNSANNATIGSGVTTGQTGISGNAYLFDNSDDGNVIKNDPTFASAIASGTFSVSVWVNIPEDSNTNNTAVFLGDRTENENYYQIKNQGDAVRFVNRSGNPFTNTTGTADVTDDTWHHIVVTNSYTGGSFTTNIYVDGALDTNLTYADGLPTVNRFAAGLLARNGPGDDLDGLIDEIQLYDEELTAAQANFLFLNPGSPIPEPSTSLAGLVALLLCGVHRKR